jgi:hypothetical protein
LDLRRADCSVVDADFINVGSESFALFDRNTGAVTQQSIVSGLVTGVKNGLAAPNSRAKPGGP